MTKQPCPNREENSNACPCPEEYCERHGICCECIKYHTSRNEKPACVR